MTDLIHNNLLRSTVRYSSGIHRPLYPTLSSHRRTPIPLPKPKRRKPRLRILSRSTSEPILPTVKMFFGGNEEALEINGNPKFPRYHTCKDVVSPLLFPRSPSAVMRGTIEEAKVVVSVAVERSPGPVRAMVWLEASVGEVIEVIVKKYRREGRSPKLDHDNRASFELHYSHFSLQCLNKSDKIGELGCRSFYLCTNSGRRSLSSGRETNQDSGNATEGDEIVLAAHSRNQLLLSQMFFWIASKKLKKIKRRTKKFWKVVTRIVCI